jgi:hypothetical protein
MEVLCGPSVLSLQNSSAMKTINDLYDEIENLKNKKLAEVVYLISNAQRADLPYVYYEQISLRFFSAVEEDKIIRVCKYIEDAYGKNGKPVEKVEMRGSHTVHIHVIKCPETMGKNA